MYNPSGSDTGREWVEIYNNDSMTYNMTGWKLRTDDTDHTLNQNGTNLILPPAAFAVIAQDAGTFLIDYSNYSSNITVIDSSWSDLSNSVNKSAVIKNSSVVFDNITYTIVTEGSTSCRINNSFVECMPTPGAANTVNTSASNASEPANLTDLRISVNVSNMQVNLSYVLFLIEIDNKTCSVLDNVTMNHNITPGTSSATIMEIGCTVYAVNWTPTAAGNYTICGSISINDTNITNNAVCKTVTVINKQCNTSIVITSESVFSAGSAMEYKLVLADSLCNETSVDIEYWIEDLFGSYAKAKLNTTQEFSCSKQVDRQWTPGAITGSEAYKIKAVLKTACSDINSSDNAAEKLIAIKGSQAASSGSSSSPTSSSSSTGGSSSDSPNITTAPKSLEIISYNPKVYIDEPFETIVNVSSNTSFSIYSYVYIGNTPVSLGGQTDAFGVVQLWKGSWDANRKELNATHGIVALVKKIENGTAPGEYMMKVKMKGGKEEDVSRVIEVMEQPKLDVTNENGMFLVSTACEDCEVLLLGEGFDKVFRKNYTLIKRGVFYALLLKDSRIFSRHFINATVSNENKPAAAITGSAVKKGGSRNNILLLYTLIRIFGNDS